MSSPSQDSAKLIDAHLAEVYRYAYRLSGTQWDAEELTQQVFLIAIENLGQLRQPDSTRSWLFTILRHCFLRIKRRWEPQLAADVELDLDQVAEDVPDADAIDGESLQAALNKLPGEYRLVVLMYYFEQCSYREIAEKLAVPIGTVMSRLARGKAALRKLLADQSLTIAKVSH